MCEIRGVIVDLVQIIPLNIPSSYNMWSVQLRHLPSILSDTGMRLRLDPDKLEVIPINWEKEAKETMKNTIVAFS